MVDVSFNGSFSSLSNYQVFLSALQQGWLLCMAKLSHRVRSSRASMRTISEGCQDIWGLGTAALPPSRIDDSLQIFISCLRRHPSVSVPEDRRVPFVTAIDTHKL